MRIHKTALLFGLFCSPAIAEGWSDYGDAFPMFPCADGWSTCEVDGQTVGPGLVTDSSGQPMPANMRFSFWDFESMPAASPFSGLSDYSGDLGNRAIKSDEPVADADDGPSLPEISGGSEIPSLPPPIDSYGDPEPSIDDDPGPSDDPGIAVAPLPPPVAYDVDTTPEPPPLPPGMATSGGGEVPYDKPPADVDAGTAKTGSGASDFPAVAPLPTPTVVPDVVDPGGSAGDGVAAVDMNVAPLPPPVADVDCDDITALETKAMLGQLGVALRKCLDGRIDQSSRLTEKDMISRVLIADAKSRDDKPDWERLMRRHLESIDRSDPNMCLTYSIYLHKLGVGKSTRVIRWSDYALENKTKWAGATHTRNVYYLHQLKSEAASRLWKRAEKRFVKDRNEKNEAKTTKYRSMAKQFSRAWLDYAKASGKDTSKPRAACVSASGNAEFCPL